MKTTDSIGMRIISYALENGTLRPFLQTGMDRLWLDNNDEGSWGVFPGEEREYYETLLSQWQKLRHKLDVASFKRSHPEVKLIRGEKLDAAALIELAREEAQSQIIFNVVTMLAQEVDVGNFTECIDILNTEGRLPDRVLQAGSIRSTRLQDADLGRMLDPDMSQVMHTGFDTLDHDYRVRPGHLITIVGRQKATKSLTMLDIGMGLLEDGWSSVFFSVELAREVIEDRMYALGSQVSLSRLEWGELHPDERDAVKQFKKDLNGMGATFTISEEDSKITMDDIEREYDRHRPHVIFIDGFYFMNDRITGKSATDPFANEMLAGELKHFTKTTGCTVFASTQSQEKQQGSKQKMGIEAKTIMGGTGLLKASDLVLGLDVDGQIRLLHQIMSRFHNVGDDHFEWEWDNLRRRDRNGGGASKLASVAAKLGMND